MLSFDRVGQSSHSRLATDLNRHRRAIIMAAMQLAVLAVVIGAATASPRYLSNSYGLPRSVGGAFYTVYRPQRQPGPPPPPPLQYRPPPPPPRPAPTRFALNDDVSSSSGLELLPPLQHVVGTKFPAVTPGPGFRFPVAQLLNPTPPPNLKH